MLHFSPDQFDSYIERSGDEQGIPRQPSLKKMSRRLCFVLRSGAPSLHLLISSEIYVALSDLQKLPEIRRYTEDVIKKIVKCDGKRRSESKELEVGAVFVRANHGHGKPGVEVVEQELTPQGAVVYAVHVTSYQAWNLIRY